MHREHLETIAEHRITLGKVQTRALELEGEGPPLLLLHGFGDSADCWRLVLDRLRKHRRAALAVDMPGFGQASRLVRDEDILPQLDSFVADAVGYWSTGRGVIIAGNSLGGCMAIRAAQDDTLPIEGIVPVAPAGFGLATWIRIIEGAPLAQALLRSPVPVPQPAVKRIVGRMYKSMALAHPRKVDPGVVAAFASHVPTRRDAIRILGTGRRIADEIQNPFQLGKVSCPVLMVWGDRDRMVYASGAERLLSEVPGSRLEMLENCGHCPQVEEPDRLTDLLCEFPAMPVEAAKAA